MDTRCSSQLGPNASMDLLSMCRTVQDGTQKSQKVFVNIPTEVGATEAEEIGVCIQLVIVACIFI